MKKLLISFFTILAIFLAVFGIVFCFKYFNLKKDSENTDYAQVIQELSSQIEKLTAEKQQLLLQVDEFTKTNSEQKALIESLTENASSLTNQVDTLNATIKENEAKISENTQKINELNIQISNLNSDISQKDGKIELLNSQIKQLTNENTSLQSLNQSNLETISTLSETISSLNSQISALKEQLTFNANSASSMKDKIDELEKSISKFESYITESKNDNEVVVIFEFAGSVYDIQIITTGSTAKEVTPESTDYITFNYWTVDGGQIDLKSYTFDTDTRVVANVTRKYKVVFEVNGEEHDVQNVESGQYACEPESPNIFGYTFEFWTINGIDEVNVSEYVINQSITFVAKMTKNFDVVENLKFSASAGMDLDIARNIFGTVVQHIGDDTVTHGILYGDVLYILFQSHTNVPGTPTIFYYSYIKFDIPVTADMITNDFLKSYILSQEYDERGIKECVQNYGSFMQMTTRAELSAWITEDYGDSFNINGKVYSFEELYFEYELNFQDGHYCYDFKFFTMEDNIISKIVESTVSLTSEEGKEDSSSRTKIAWKKIFDQYKVN